MSELTKVKIGQSTLLVGLDWLKVEPKARLLLPLAIKRLASEGDKHFADTNFVEKTDDAQARYQYVLIDESDALSEDKVVTGARFALSCKEKYSKKENQAFVFIKIIDNGQYWISAITSRGEFLNEYEIVVKDRFELADKLEELSLTESVNFSYLETESAIKGLINRFIDDDEFSETIIPSEDIASILASTEEVKRVYKPSRIKIKKIGSAALAIGAVTLGFFSWSYMSQIDAFSYLENDSLIKDAKNNESKYSKLISKSKTSSKNWSDESFRDATLDQFIESYKRSLYDPLQITWIFKEIEETLPVYLREWKLEEIQFVENRFLVTYSRIPTSIGVYFLLDEKVKEISDKNEYLNIKQFSLEDEGETRVYSIIPNEKMNRKGEMVHLDSMLTEERKVKKQMRRSWKDAKDYYSDFLDATVKYNNLTFSDKWIKRESLNLKVQAESAIDKAERAEVRVDKLFGITDSMKLASIDDKYIIGQVMDFVTMMQMDSLFNWYYPKKIDSYPNAEMLSEKQRKSKKSKKKSSPKYKQYQAGIEVYSLQIESQKTESEGDESNSVSTYGINDMIQLGYLINKPYIVVEKVTYDRDSQEWDFVIQFNRMTSEFEKTVNEYTLESQGYRRERNSNEN
jgi:hypothetical protein